MEFIHTYFLNNHNKRSLFVYIFVDFAMCCHQVNYKKEFGQVSNTSHQRNCHFKGTFSLHLIFICEKKILCIADFIMFACQDEPLVIKLLCPFCAHSIWCVIDCCNFLYWIGTDGVASWECRRAFWMSGKQS